LGTAQKEPARVRGDGGAAALAVLFVCSQNNCQISRLCALAGFAGLRLPPLVFIVLIGLQSSGMAGAAEILTAEKRLPANEEAIDMDNKKSSNLR
jgi:hypothetical protein